MDRAEMRQHARRLRVEGLSTRQIAAALGIPFNRTVQGWLVGVDPPSWTLRPNAKDEERLRARELRSAGMTYPEIASALGVSKSSVSLWVRDLPRPARDRTAHARVAANDYWRRESRRREIERQQTKFAAASEIGVLSERELLLVGAALYWAEGTKDKPYRRAERVVFTNSDPHVIRIFLSWLRLLGVPPQHVRYRLSIHETADATAAQAWWAEVAGVPADVFLRATLKRSKPLPGRLNVGGAYHGCLVVSVVQSAQLYQQIEGWFRGTAFGAARISEAGQRWAR